MGLGKIRNDGKDGGGFTRVEGRLGGEEGGGRESCDGPLLYPGRCLLGFVVLFETVRVSEGCFYVYDGCVGLGVFVQCGHS